MSQAVWCWLDLEMTGLDPEDCAIVQLAMILTDEHFKELAPALDIVVWQPDSVLERMCPFVREMHEKSGLLPKIRASRMTVADAEMAALKLLSHHAAYRTAKLAGNSITQDRRFLWRYMPHLEAYLHYRQIDVSTLKELYWWWDRRKFPKESLGQHTALVDVRQSIAELQHYRQAIWHYPEDMKP